MGERIQAWIAEQCITGIGSAQETLLAQQMFSDLLPDFWALVQFAGRKN
jgi:hypothetical protein